jgi:ADP-ribosyl-[dinitrogen reductase] hydrolase
MTNAAHERRRQPFSADLQDRARGLLVGLAVGDALGAPVEFDTPESIAGRREELFSMPGGGTFNWAPGELTDDTQMSLVLSRHLRDRRGTVHQAELARELAAWAVDANDVGNQTRTVLSAVSQGTDWKVALEALSGDAAGNGSLMRVAPVALAASSRGQASELARAQSEVTHPNGSCMDACAVFASLLWDVLDTGELGTDGLGERAKTPEVRACIERAADIAMPRMSGWVLHTLTGALWAVQGADSYADAVWRAVCLGYDADTVAAVAGALAGAAWGYRAIPASLTQSLCSRHPMFAGDYPTVLVSLADDLVAGRRPLTG